MKGTVFMGFAATLARLLSFRVRSLALACLMFTCAALAQLSASAHFFNLNDHHWPWSPGHHELVLGYYADCTGGWVGSADQGANAWTYAWNSARNDWAMPVHFVKQQAPDCSGPDKWLVNQFLGYMAAATLGWSVNYDEDCFLWWCWWDPQDRSENIQASNIWLNSFPGTFGSRSTFDRQLVVVHELGHSLGLAHAGYYAGETYGCYSVMDNCMGRYNTPQQHDIFDVNALYRGW